MMAKTEAAVFEGIDQASGIGDFEGNGFNSSLKYMFLVQQLHTKILYPRLKKAVSEC
jgi:hypothetical protein